MKKKLLLILSLVVLLVCVLAISVNADTVKVGEVTYTVTQGATAEENTAVVNSHKDKAFTTTDITIPVSVQDADGVVYYVTGLHSEAFRNTNLTSITFEKGSRIEEIGNYCFFGSKSLTTIVLPDSLKYIRGEAFRNCSVLTALYLPDTVESIGFYENGSANTGSGSGTFAGCGKLYFVNELGETTKPNEWYAPSALREMSGEIFKERGSLNTTVIFGENFIYLDNAFAFGKLSAVNNARRTFIFEGDFTREGAQFAYSCETNNINLHFTNPNITTVSFLKFHTAWAGTNINNSYAYIYGVNKKAVLTNQATADAETLEWVDIYRNSRVVVSTPNGEKEILLDDKALFEISFNFEITGIKSFTDPDDSSITYTKNDIVRLYINATPTDIIANAIADLSNLKEVILEEGARVVIYKNTFKNCPKLERLDMRQGNATFKNEAFYNFTQLKELLLSANNYRFDDASFKQSGLTSLVIPDGANIEYFGKAAFTGTKIKSLYIGNITGDVGLANQRATFDGILTLETVVLMNINTFGEWAFSIGDTVTAECDLTIYSHSQTLTLHANAFNNRQNGGRKVFLYTLATELNVTSFNKSNYTVYAGIPHAYEYKHLTDSTCTVNGTGGYATDCTCGVDYRETTYITYSNIDTSINGVDNEPYGKEIVYEELAPHTPSENVFKIVYENGFLNNGTTTFACAVCNGEGITEEKATALPLFECLGYSVSEMENSKSITQGYKINLEAIALYNSLSEGKGLRYGVFAGTESALGGITELFENGEKIQGKTASTFDCTDFECSFIDIKIKGLEKATAYADVPVYCCAYVLSYEGDEIVSTYLTSGLYGTAIESETLTNAYSYNQIAEAIEYMKTNYVGYDGYLWQADKKTDTLSAPLANNVMENTLELVDNVFFTRNDISAGTKVVLMGNYFEYSKSTQYSNSTVSKITTYVNGNGSLDIGKINLQTAEYTLIDTVSVTNGKNVIDLSCTLKGSETLVLGGDNTTVGLYSVSGVNADDEYGVYSIDTEGFAVSQIDGLRNKLIVNVEIELSTTETECLTPELEDVYADRTSGYKPVVNTVAPFIYVDEDLFEGHTFTSMKFFVNTVSYVNGYATMDIAVFTVTENFYVKKSIPSFNEVYTIKLPSEFFGGKTTINAWYEIDFTEYAYKPDGTKATEGIAVAEGESLAFAANQSDTIIWGFNDKVFSEVVTCEQFYHKSNNQLTFGSSTSVLNFLFYYDRATSYESVKDHLAYLTELDKEAYVKSELKDKQLSILGDSISTYQGYSNDSSQGLGSNAVFFSSSQMAVSDTYWYQLMEKYGMNLCVNNSWSGAYASLHTPNVGSNVDRDGSVSSGVIRANYLAKKDGTAPDYIVIFIGINDLNNSSVTDETVCEAYEEILDIVSEKYPQAKVFCVNMPNRSEGNDPRPINEGIKSAVDEHDNAYLVDLYNSHYSGEKYKYNSANGSGNTDNLHPSVLGMDFVTELIAEAMEEAIMAEYNR